jgi:hypothetical protein
VLHPIRTHRLDNLGKQGRSGIGVHVDADGSNRSSCHQIRTYFRGYHKLRWRILSADGATGRYARLTDGMQGIHAGKAKDCMRLHALFRYLRRGGILLEWRFSAVSLLSRIWRIPYVFDVMDLQPDAAAELGMLPEKALQLRYWIEQIGYRHAALVSTLTRGMRNRIDGKGVPPEKVTLFEPSANDELLEVSIGEGDAFRRKHGLKR